MRADHDTTAQAAGGLSPAMQRTASFLALGAGLLLLGGWLNIRPTLRQRALAHLALASPGVNHRVMSGGTARRSADGLAEGQKGKR